MDLHVGRRLTSAEISSLLSEARSRTLLLTGVLSDEDLRLQHDTLMSPIVWDLGHIGHFEEVWLVVLKTQVLVRERSREQKCTAAGLRKKAGDLDPREWAADVEIHDDASEEVRRTG